MLVAEVCLDLDIWKLDRGFSYLVPDLLRDRVAVGSIVRVPLRGRRVRAWVVGLAETEPSEELSEILSVSGRAPVFDEGLLLMARDLARLYVHPLSSFLRLFTPARMGRGARAEPALGRGGGGTVEHSSGAISWARTSVGDESSGPRVALRNTPPPLRPPAPRLVRLGSGDDVVGFYAGLVGEALGKGLGAIVVVPEVREGSRVIETLAAKFENDVVVVHSGLDPAVRSKALWAVAEGKKRVVLGGRGAVFSPAFPVGVIVVHAEHDRSLKEQRGPYYDAREVAVARGVVTGAEVVLGSHTPSLVSLYREGGWEVVEPSRAKERVGWPVVEVVEAPKVGMPRRAVAAIIEARRVGVRTIVLLPRARATRAGPGPREVARFLGRVVPGASIGLADRPDLGEPGRLKGVLEADVIVATEAALAEIERPPVGCAVALGVDTLLGRPLGRASEDAFETLWSLGLLVAGMQPRARFIVEASDPTHHVVQALTRGDYRFFAEHELRLREEDGSPPFVRLVRLKSAAQPTGRTLEALNRVAAGAGARVLGPAPGDRGVEMLIKAPDLDALAGPLRELVAGAPERILVEVDPREW